MTPTEAFIALNMLPHVGPIRVRKLLEVFGSPEQILEARPADLRNVPGIGSEVADSILSWRSHATIEEEVKRVHTFGATVITQADPRYPALLRDRALDSDGCAADDFTEPDRRLLDAVPVERTPRAAIEPSLRPQDVFIG